MFQDRGMGGRHGAVTEPSGEIEVAGVSLRTLTPCHSVWLFDPSRMRFRRVPRDVSLDMPSPNGEWLPYHRLDVERSTGVFTVSLNERSTHMLRSRIHEDPCSHCQSEDRTEEVPFLPTPPVK